MRGATEPARAPRHRAMAVVIYAAMAGGALVLGWARGRSIVRLQASVPALDSLGASLGLGAALALATILATRWVVLRTAWGRALRGDFRALLADAGPGDAIWLAVLSGVGEELLFRGALLPWWGLVGSSLAFGTLHVGPSRRFLGWTVWASATGLLLGLVFVATGRIEGAIAAHVAINAVNLRFVLAFDGRLDRPRAAPGEQSLVARRTRREPR